jgi:hypothetical protein
MFNPQHGRLQKLGPYHQPAERALNGAQIAALRSPAASTSRGGTRLRSRRRGRSRRW